MKVTQNISRGPSTVYGTYKITHGIKAKQRSKRYYDKKARPQEYETGDEVYMIKEPNKGKLSDQYKGPYRIKRTLENNNVGV